MASVGSRAYGLTLPRTLLKCIRSTASLKCGSQLLRRSYSAAASPPPDGSKPGGSKADMGPLRFTDSGAEKWTTAQTFGDPSPVQRPWYERYIVTLSLAVFLGYFCLLREENDLDEDIARPLYQRVPALERADLLAKLELYRSEGRDVTELKRRLRELSERTSSS